MSNNYCLKNVIDKLEAIYCGPLYYAVPLKYAIFSWKIFHPKKPRTREEILYNSVFMLPETVGRPSTPLGNN
jgi:hypothetical protein